MKSFKFILPLIILFFSSGLSAQLEIQLEEIASGFSNVVKIAHAGDDRLFIVERSGRIKIIDGSGTTLGTPFLDIDDRVIATGGQSEQGLLGLTFHPDYANTGYFYVHYTNNSGNSQISRFSVTANDANVADPSIEMSIITIAQPFGNHNGGEVEFGPDGYLYIGMGDGGSGNDPGNRAQNNQSLLGKMLRLDISQEPYAIPADNPFVSDATTLDEIWATGLRNPWRFSFDAMTGDMWIADVGQWVWEEINVQPASSTGGENYGWRCREGPVVNGNVNTNDCGPVTDYVQPIFEYVHTQFGPCSITGGFVYRGCQYPDLHGYYLYSDYCSGDIWALKKDDAGNVENEEVASVGNGAWTTFGQGNDMELYVSGLNSGKIYHIASGPAITEETIIEDQGILSVNDTYESYQWFLDGNEIDGATGPMHTALLSGNYSVQVVHASGCAYGSNVVAVIITSTNGIDGLSSFLMQPNPVANELNLEMTLEKPVGDLSLKIYSLDGKVVLRKELKSGFKISEKINMSGLESAVYLLRISNGDQELIRRIVKK